MNDKEKLEFLYGEYGNVNLIKKELFSSSENAVAIGFYLDEIQRTEYWKATDYFKNFKSEKYTTKSGIIKYTEYTFYSYCHDEFNFSRRSVDRYINIFFAFCRVNKSGVRTKFIDDKYKDYNCSQLSEMLGLSDKARAAISPDMSVRDIQKVKKMLPFLTAAKLNLSKSNESAADEASVSESPDTSVTENSEYSDKVAAFVNNPDAIAPEDVNIVFDKSYEEDKIFKKKKYHVCGLLYDKFVATPSQYTQQFVKLQEYFNKGYLVRLVLYEPNDDEGGKAANE